MKRGKEDGYRHQSLIIYLPINFTIFPPFYHSLFGEYDGAGGVEKRGLEGAWRGENGVHYDTNA